MIQRKKQRVWAGVFVALLWMTSGCIVVVQGDGACFGEPRVLNPIPDVVLREGERYHHDLNDPRRPVFIHPYNRGLVYEARVSNHRVVRAFVRRGVLEIEARNPGSATVSVSGFDPDCDEGAEVRFRVFVNPS